MLNVSILDIFPNSKFIDFKAFDEVNQTNAHCNISAREMRISNIISIPVSHDNFKIAFGSDHIIFIENKEGNKNLTIFTLQTHLNDISTSFVLKIENNGLIHYFEQFRDQLAIGIGDSILIYKISQRMSPSSTHHFNKIIIFVRSLDCLEIAKKNLMDLKGDSDYLVCSNGNQFKTFSTTNSSLDLNVTLKATNPSQLSYAGTCHDKIILNNDKELFMLDLFSGEKNNLNPILYHGITNPLEIAINGRTLLIGNKSEVSEFHFVNNCSDIQFFKRHLISSSLEIQRILIFDQFFILISKDNQVIFKETQETDNSQAENVFSFEGSGITQWIFRDNLVSDGLNSFGMIGVSPNANGYLYYHFQESEQFLICQFHFPPKHGLVIRGEALFCDNNVTDYSNATKYVSITMPLKTKPLIYNPNLPCHFSQIIQLEFQPEVSIYANILFFSFILFMIISITLLIRRHKKHLAVINYSEVKEVDKTAINLNDYTSRHSNSHLNFESDEDDEEKKA